MDRVYPSSKPQSLKVSDPSIPPTKAATRLPYRPQPAPAPARRRRSCWCRCFCWMLLFLLFFVLLIFIAGVIIWLLYRPQRPSFSISTVQISSFNVTSAEVRSIINLSLAVRNPNRELVFTYDPISVSISSDGVDLAEGAFVAFFHGTKNTTVLRKSLSGAARASDAASADRLKSAIRKGKLSLNVALRTKLKAKLIGLKSRKFKIAVSCEDITAPLPKGKGIGKALAVSDGKCKVKLAIKIWKWQI